MSSQQKWRMTQEEVCALGYLDSTSETGGVLGQVGAGVGEAADCCDSGCGADNGSVLERMRKKKRVDLQLF